MKEERDDDPQSHGEVVDQIGKQEIQYGVDKTSQLVKKNRAEGAQPRRKHTIKELPRGSFMAEGLIPFLENQHDREPLWCACTLIHAAWETNRRN